MAQTFILFKPDTFTRNLQDILIDEIESHGFHIKKKKSIIVSKELILKHYEDVIERVPIIDFKDRICEAFVGKEVWAMLLESDSNDTVEDFRTFLGKTNPLDASPDSLRGKYGNDSYEQSTKEKRMLNNLIHASDSRESCEKEIRLWFSLD